MGFITNTNLKISIQTKQVAEHITKHFRYLKWRYSPKYKLYGYGLCKGIPSHSRLIRDSTTIFWHLNPLVNIPLWWTYLRSLKGKSLARTNRPVIPKVRIGGWTHKKGPLRGPQTYPHKVSGRFWKTSNLDLLQIDVWNKKQTYFPKWWWMMVVYQGTIRETKKSTLKQKKTGTKIDVPSRKGWEKGLMVLRNRIRSMYMSSLQGGSSQDLWVVRITPIYKPRKGHLEWVPQPDP